jgi:two-component system response regulator AtoC
MVTDSLPKDRARVLVVAAAAQRDELEAQVRRVGHRTEVASTPTAVTDSLSGHPADAVIIDLDDTQAGALFETLRRDWPDVGIVSIESSSGRTPRTVITEAVDVLSRPFSDQELGRALAKVLAEAKACAQAPPPGSVDGNLLGESKPMQKVHELLRRAATGTATVLIRGESGTGKELVARTLHSLSQRRSGPFVKVHCAALPDTLLESELFGYERGAFTGATSRKPGRVDLAQGGTLFLDEIGDITPAMQVKLLHLLQDRQFERLGGSESISANVRFVAATHRDLEAMVKSGAFREDLFYRLNVVTSWLPPLRARRDDIDALARHFCAAFRVANGKPGLTLSDSALASLRRQRWPGNVRELQNFVEKLVVLSEGAVITDEDVDRELSLETITFATQGTGVSGDVSASRPASSAADLPESAPVVPLSEEVRQAERRALLRALRHTRGNRTLAARVLGVSRATFYKKLDEHQLV